MPVFRSAAGSRAFVSETRAGPGRRVSRIRKLGWWIADYVTAGLWQLRALCSRRDPSEFATGELRPVVILPGVYENWRFMLPVVEELHARGHPVFVVSELGHNRIPVGEGARRVDAFLAAAGLRDVVLVAHSKGGLVGKQVMAFGAAAPRVRAMVTMATPFGGSSYARFMVNRTLRSFVPENEALTALGRSLEVNTRIVSISPAFDPHIPEGSVLPGARNVRVATGGHFRVLADPRARAETIRVAGGALPAAGEPR